MSKLKRVDCTRIGAILLHRLPQLPVYDSALFRADSADPPRHGGEITGTRRGEKKGSKKAVGGSLEGFTVDVTLEPPLSGG